MQYMPNKSSKGNILINHAWVRGHVETLFHGWVWAPWGRETKSDTHKNTLNKMENNTSKSLTNVLATEYFGTNSPSCSMLENVCGRASCKNYH